MITDIDNIEIKVGDKVYWNDPGLFDLETMEDRREAWLTLWDVDEVSEEMVCISNDYSEAEVYPKELEVAIIPRKEEDYEE